MKKIVGFCFFMIGILLFSNSTYAAKEKIILQTNFSSGTIDPLQYAGSGGYSIFDPTMDPLGTNSWGVKIWNSPTEGSRGVLRYWTSWGNSEKLNFVRVKETIVLTNVSKWQTLLEIQSVDMYHTGYRHLILELWPLPYLRVKYLDSGAMRTQELGIAAEPNRKYIVEVWLKVGNGNGEIQVFIDGTMYLNLTGLTNFERGFVDAFEFGNSWGTKNNTQYIYEINVSGSEVELINVTGRAIDEQGKPIPTVGIRVGSPPPETAPWTTGTYYVNIYTDSDGNFSFEHLKTVIPEIKFIKPGYGDPSEPVGSITRLKNIDLTQIVGSVYDLGNITLQSRPVIKPSSLPNSTYWPFRSVVIFPWAIHYSSQGYLDTLDALKSKYGDKFNIIDLRFLVAQDENGMPTHDDNIYGGLFSYSELAIAIDEAHARGFKVMLSTYGSAKDEDLFNPAWFDAYKEVLLEHAEFAANHSVEYFNIAFETRPFYYPENREKIVEILEAIRAYADSRPDWNPKIMYIGLENSRNLTRMKESTWLLHPALDIVGIEDWRRKAGIFDPTEEEMKQTWRYGLSWDWKPEPPDMLQVLSGFLEWVKKPVIINFGTGTGDGSSWAPYISGYRPNVQDQEEMALFYKVYFDMVQNLSIYGVAMEHYSFTPSNTTITGCFRETIAEEFIKVGLDAHSQNFSIIEGKIKDKNESPLSASIYVFREGIDIIVDNSRTDKDGNYRVEFVPGFYDIQYNLTDFFIKILSLNATSSLYDVINYVTKSPNKISFIFNGMRNQSIQIYSERKPLSIKLNGTAIPSWNWDETSKLLTIYLL
jgi:hypothetical protein